MVVAVAGLRMIHAAVVQHEAHREEAASPRRTETGFLVFFDLPRRSNAPPRCSEALPRCSCKLCFCGSFPLSLTIIHWINEDPNK